MNYCLGKAIILIFKFDIYKYLFFLKRNKINNKNKIL